MNVSKWVWITIVLLCLSYMAEGFEENKSIMQFSYGATGIIFLYVTSNLRNVFSKIQMPLMKPRIKFLDWAYPLWVTAMYIVGLNLKLPNGGQEETTGAIFISILFIAVNCALYMLILLFASYSIQVE